MSYLKQSRRFEFWLPCLLRVPTAAEPYPAENIRHAQADGSFIS